MKNYQSTADYKFIELCNEYDELKFLYDDMKKQRDELHKQLSSLIEKDIKDSQNMIGELFTIMLNSELTEKGILIKQIKE